MSNTWQFVAEWFDPTSQLKRKFVLKYFFESNQIEMIELKRYNKTDLFLRKTECPAGVSASDFFLGSKVVIMSRELEIVDYADQSTKQALQHQTQKTFAILTPDAYHNWGKIVDVILRNLNIVKLKMVVFTPIQVESMCAVFGINSRRGNVLSKGLSLVVCVHGEDGINKLADLSFTVQNEFGSGENAPAIICATTGIQVSEGLELISGLANTSTLDCCTCCIIKPHAVKERNIGKILDVIIGQGYELSALETLFFDKVQAEEMLEVYKGVVPEYREQVTQLSSGICVALELRAEDAVQTFRQTAGPWDVDMAKELRPETLRALFGTDRVKSAVHCTDLVTDGLLECEYCFRIMKPVN